MSKFIIHGTLVEEPKRNKTTKGLDYVSLIIEETYESYLGTTINTYEVCFFGKTANVIPSDISLKGVPVIIVGAIGSMAKNGRYYSSLRGEQITFLTAKTFDEPKPVLEQADVDKVKSKNLDTIDIPDDDLPF